MNALQMINALMRVPPSSPVMVIEAVEGPERSVTFDLIEAELYEIHQDFYLVSSNPFPTPPVVFLGSDAGWDFAVHVVHGHE